MNEYTKALYTSNTDDWETPQEFFDWLDEIHNFTLDPCCTDQNAKCKKYYTKEDDGLSKSWEGETVFCNPPYGRKRNGNPGQETWIKKCHDEANKH